MSYLNLNDAEQQTGDLIPDGTIAKVRQTLRPGGVGEGGWLTASKSSDAQYLNLEFVVLEGPYARRKFWGNFTVDGGSRDEKGQSKGGLITRATLRAEVESAYGIQPGDESPAARQKRQLANFGALDGLEFVAKIGIEKGKDGYQDKNKLSAVITPDKQDWARVMGFGGATGPGPVPTQLPHPVAQQAAQASAGKPAWMR